MPSKSDPTLFCTGCIFFIKNACSAGKLDGDPQYVTDCSHRVTATVPAPDTSPTTTTTDAGDAPAESE